MGGPVSCRRFYSHSILFFGKLMAVPTRGRATHSYALYSSIKRDRCEEAVQLLCIRAGAPSQAG